MMMNRSLLSLVWVVLLATSVWAGWGSDLYPLYPKIVPKSQLTMPENTDINYAFQHCDDQAEYYLGSGALNDTFFITFEPPVACSVKYVEIQWNDGGSVLAFAAHYSDAAYDSFPDGTGPNRGTTPISPIGTWITGLVPHTATSGGWRTLGLGGAEWVNGDPTNITDTEIFGIGFIKGDAIPHPLADKMDSKGIRFSYTWFGGPWMPSHGYPEIWGAYSGNLATGTVIDIMMRVWVSYPWGMPILIQSLSQQCNTFNYTEPFTIYADLVDDGIGINFMDIVQLKYTVDGGAEMSVDMSPVEPGSNTYYADIPAQAIGSQIIYWVYTLDDAQLENQSLPKTFLILEPENPNADMLFVDDGTSDRVDAYIEALDALGVSYEYWDVGGNFGIDGSVTGYGWNGILLAGWGISSCPALDEPNIYADFLDGGGGLAIIDQDFFYGNGLDPFGTFQAGDFSYDYLGLATWANDDTSYNDAVYMGAEGDPIGDDFSTDYYVTYWDTPDRIYHMDPDDFWADYFEVGLADEIFYGENSGYVSGAKYDAGSFRTVFLGFMAEASCYYDTAGSGLFTATPEFTTLLENIINWTYLGVDDFTPDLAPAKFSLSQNYPNPFNPTTTIKFDVAFKGYTTLKVYNTMGQEVATLTEGILDAGAHSVDFDASNLSSGVYYYKLTSGDLVATQKMLLLK
jgi:hypothetical protein